MISKQQLHHMYLNQLNDFNDLIIIKLSLEVENFHFHYDQQLFLNHAMMQRIVYVYAGHLLVYVYYFGLIWEMWALLLVNLVLYSRFMFEPWLFSHIFLIFVYFHPKYHENHHFKAKKQQIQLNHYQLHLKSTKSNQIMVNSIN